MKFLITLIAITSLTLLLSCSHTKVVNHYHYDLDCQNCKSYSDSILTFSVSSSVADDNPIVLTIFNNSKEVIILDERYFTFSEVSTVKMNPIGMTNPNNSITTTNAISSSSELHGNTSGLERLMGYGSQSTGLSEFNSYSVTNNPRPIIVIPPMSKIEYDVYNYLIDKYRKKEEEAIEFDGYRWSIDRKKLKDQILQMPLHPWNINIVFKMINEDKWRNSTITVKPKDLKVEYNEVSKYK